MLSQNIVSISSLKNLQKAEKSHTQVHKSFVSYPKMALFLKYFLWNTFWFEKFLFEKALHCIWEGFALLSQKMIPILLLQKSKRAHFQTLRAFTSNQKVASKSFSKTLFMTDFPRNWFQLCHSKIYKNAMTVNFKVSEFLFFSSG